VANKKEQLAQEVAKAVGAGKLVALDTVDFSDPNRPKTCLEVDFPILPVNQVAVIQGNDMPPIYSMQKWWAWRRASIFRAMLLAAATPAPADPSHAAKKVWDVYYGNHQKKGALSHLKVLDPFMGSGTTLIEGSRLGLQMIGNDLSPVAWFKAKHAFSKVSKEDVARLLAAIEAEVRPQIIPYYCCDGPNGEKGTWTHVASKRVMPPDFDPLSLTPDERREYHYEGPEVIYTFWAKHGPCQVTGCGHRTPIMTSPVMAVKTLTVKHWEHACGKCGGEFHVEEDAARMAPDVPLFVAPSEYPFSVLDRRKGVVCPHCGHAAIVNLGKSTNKKIELSLLVHPQWLKGSPKQDAQGRAFGGSARDSAESSVRWSDARAATIRLLEVRGTLPEEVTCPETKVTFKTAVGTVPKKANFACGSCGTVQEVVEAMKASAKTGPLAGYAFQGYAPGLDSHGAPYNGRFFAPFGSTQSRQYDAALLEWETRRETDLAEYWPRSDIPFGHMTHQRQPLPQHGFLKWADMFSPRQLLVHSQLLKAIVSVGSFDWAVREFVLGAFQQYLRNQSLFTLWNVNADKLEPQFANNNYHPKATVVENCVFANLGRGNWASCVEGLLEGRDWAIDRWEAVSVEGLKRRAPQLAAQATGKSEKVNPSDPVGSAMVCQGSSTDLNQIATGSLDLVITDPPFGGLLHYSELADFFYVWLRLALKDEYPAQFAGEYTPKSLEAVANKAREPDDPDGFYQRLLTQCWREAHRVLRPSGILAFTFHHSEDEPWIAVLESLFDAGFYLEATYPIRSDETKGEGEFGSKTIEYDIIHVCRKRTEEPTPVSWGRMRREVMADVRQLQGLLENHAKEGLPAADIQVIRRGKALEYFSRHYGKVYVDEGRPISVKDALVGINQLIDEDADKGREPPPVNAEPITRQFLRTFGNASELKRDQVQKFLKGSITTPDDFEQRGWCAEKSKVFTRVNPLDFAREWSGKHRRRLTSDLDQALVLIGACVDGSGINAADTLKNENFKPHVALKPLLEWMYKHGPDQGTRNAASRAVSIYNAWAASQAVKPQQQTLFEEYEL
jgi:SAM-dependent methyltransferase